jgi:hypothetical protein
MSRTLPLPRFHKIWSQRLAEVLQFGSLKAGQLLLLLPSLSQLQWTLWKSAKDNEMQRDALCKSSMWHPTHRIQEARQAQSLHNRRPCLLLVQAGHEPDQRHKVLWRSYRTLNVHPRCRAKRLVRKRCRLRHALVATRTDRPTVTPLLRSQPLVDPPLVALSHLAVTRTASQLLQHPLQRPHKGASLGQSQDRATSSRAPCLRPRLLARHLQQTASMAVSRVYHKFSLLNNCHSQTSVATSAVLLSAASQIACSVAAVHADSHNRHKRAARPPRSETEGIRPSAWPTRWATTTTIAAADLRPTAAEAVSNSCARMLNNNPTRAVATAADSLSCPTTSV